MPSTLIVDASRRPLHDSHVWLEPGSGPIGSRAADDPGLVPIWLVPESRCEAVLAGLGAAQARWARVQGFAGERHRQLLLPGGDGALGAVLWGTGASAAAVGASAMTLWDAAALPERLPPGRYRIANLESGATQFALGWLLGGYRYNRCRSSARSSGSHALLAPDSADVSYVTAMASAVCLARDLVNTPANLLGPAELAAIVEQLAQRTGGQFKVVTGDILNREYPLIAAVGAGSARAPRLIDVRWPRPGAPRVCLVGKGVCFDTGGLDIKSSSAMLLMKKDMGGAACALATAQALVEMGAPIDLRLLIPAVENSISGNSYRPGDVIKSRKGLTVEIGNTDAEGRLVLADAITEADSEPVDVLIDMATLTGAARTALGPDLPALMGNDDELLRQLMTLGMEHDDPLWQLPLWCGYDDELGSRIADLGNVASSAFAGAIFGGLFLGRFVTAASHWAHIDLYAWNPRERAGRPSGGEAQAVRAVYQLIRARFG